MVQLWTIQTEAAWQSLNHHGHLRCRDEDADRDFLPAYLWMASQMNARIGTPPSGVSFPIWAWCQYDGERRKRPDLRSFGHLPTGTCGYRVEFTLGDDAVLLSDFELWHYVLIYWYLPKSEKDADDFERRQGTLRCSWDHPAKDPLIDRQIRKSWERIFHLDWSDEYVASVRSEKSIQATLWQLELSQVVSVDRFVAR